LCVVLLTFVLGSQSQFSQFPSDFGWGTATAAYQVEGAVKAGGRGPSIWDIFSHTPGKVYNNQTGDVAVDQYHRYVDDLKMMGSLGFKFYRFSISPTRILPNGRGQANQAGIRYYNNIINTALANGLVPFATLYHWDLAQALATSYGGWLNIKSVYDFVTYARICFQQFGDRVKHWLTFNEPLTFSWIGYGVGVHAPGRCSDRTRCRYGNSSTEPYIVSHNVLLAHARAVQLYRAQFQRSQNGFIGITLNCDWSEPLTDSAADILAAGRHLDFQLGWYADPIFFGDYPPIMRQLVGDRLPVFSTEDKLLLKGSHDFFGLNHYTTAYGFYQPLSGEPNWGSDQLAGTTVFRNGVAIGPAADSSWLYVVPWGIGKLLRYVSLKYGNPPIYITENGVDVPNESSLPLAQALNDTFRVDFYSGYLKEVLSAINDGVAVKGYIAWSFCDNFEWADGYQKRFGLHYIDYKNNLTRYQKASALWFKQLIAGEIQL